MNENSSLQYQLESILAQLVAMPSASMNRDACHDIITYAIEQLRPLGMYISASLDAQHPWVIATTQATKQPKILLVAHLDVVPATVNGQYELRKTADRLYGRGVWDMKYAAAGFIHFAKQNADALKRLDFGILFTTDEEVGGFQGVREILRQGWRTQLAFIPDYGEGWRIEENAKGIVIIKIRATGKSAHGSRPWEGDNAASKLIPLLHELSTVYPSTDHSGPTLSITMLTSGGGALTQIPDEAEAMIDFRAFSTDEKDAYLLLLGQLCKEYDATFENVIDGSPVTLDHDHPLVVKYKHTLNAIGIQAKYDKSYGATDARWFAEYDIPCIVTGPHGHGAHGGDEWMSRQDLSTFYKIIDDYINNNACVKILDTASNREHTK